MFRSSALILLLAALPLVAGAEERTSYAVLRGGIYVPDGGESGYAAEIALGYAWRIFATELGYLHYHACTDIDEPACSDVTTQAVFGTVKWSISGAAERFHAFLGGGLGLYWDRFRTFDRGYGSSEVTRTEFGPHLLLGAEYRLSSQVFLSAEVKRVYPFGPYIMGGRSYSNGQMNMLGIRYRF